MSFRKVVCVLFLVGMCVGSIQAQEKYNKVKDYSEGLAAVQLDGKWGFIDENGKEWHPFEI